MQLRDTLAGAAGRLRTDATSAAETVFDFGMWTGLIARLIHVGVIIALAALALFVVSRFKRRMIRRVDALPPLDPRRQRTLTVADLIGSTARYVVWGLAVIMALAELGLDIGPLLAGAGVAGLAIGFGAQTLVKDVISGVFLLFDRTIHVGDLVTIEGQSGTVEYIGLRLIKVRMFDGELLMVPAGELRTFGNRSVGFARVIVEVPLNYEQNLEEVIKALDEVAQEWADVEENRAALLEEKPEVQAVIQRSDGTLAARIVAQVRPGEQAGAERSLRRRVKERLDARGFTAPAARRTVLVQRDAMSAPGADTSPEADDLAAAAS